MDGRMQKHRITRWLGRLFVVLLLTASWVAQAAVVTVPLTFVYEDYPFTTNVATYDAAGCREGAMRRCEIQKASCWIGNGVYDLGHFSVDRGGVNGKTCYYSNGDSSAAANFANLRLVCAFEGYSGMRYNVSNKTCERDVPDTLIITLSGGTEVEPSKGLDIKTLPIIATVIDENTKQPTTKAVQVSISLKVDPTSGGHDHGDSTRPRGGIADKKVCASDGECWANPTVNGVLKFNFRAPEASGRYTITASCDGCSNTATKPVNVKVEGLQPIPAFPYYALEEADPDNPGTTKVIGATDLHSKNHYLTHAAAQRLMIIAIEYHSHPKFKVLDWHTNKMVPPPLLHVNDASLEWGGKFDIHGTWKGSHAEHMRGTSVDLRANENEGAIPPELFEEFEKMLGKHIPGDATENKFLRECTPNEKPSESNPNPIQHNRKSRNYCVSQADGSFDTNRHYHVRLLGE